MRSRRGRPRVAAGARRARSRGSDGYHQGVARAAAGDRYRFRLDGGDPCRIPPRDSSRMARSVRRRSSIHTRFKWSDGWWRGIDVPTSSSTRCTSARSRARGRGPRRFRIFRASSRPWRDDARDHADCGFCGAIRVGLRRRQSLRADAPVRHARRLAPLRRCGAPLGLGVILDVVYNHIGPSGSYFDRFSDSYFSQHETEWGRAINFDGPDSAPVREFFVSNAAYWIDEFHFDGLRLDATQSIVDRSPEHVIAEIARRVRQAAPDRSIWVIAENERQEAKMMRPPADGGYGLDALWNDDYHHSAIVALTGRREAYYTDYLGQPQEFVSAAKHGFLYQGQWYHWQKQRRGQAALDIPPQRFVVFLREPRSGRELRDGSRMHQRASAGKLRAMTALTLLGPGTPMLFQGQEFASTAPFLYFADHEPDLAAAVRKGPVRISHPIPEPRRSGGPEDGSQNPGHPHVRAMQADRRRTREGQRVVDAPSRSAAAAADGSDARRARRAWRRRRRARATVVRPAVLRPARHVRGPAPRRESWRGFFDAEVAPEPLLAPPAGHRWRLRWSSESRAYGGADAGDREESRLATAGRKSATFRRGRPIGGSRALR